MKQTNRESPAAVSRLHGRAEQQNKRNLLFSGAGGDLLRVSGGILAALVLMGASALLIYAGTMANDSSPLLFYGAAAGLFFMIILGGSHLAGVESRRQILIRTLNRQEILAANLRSIDEMYKALLESVPEITFFAFDEHLRFYLADGCGLVQLGLEPHDVLGKLPAEVFAQGVAEDLLPHMLKALDGKSSSLEISYWDRTLFLRTLPLNKHGEKHTGLLLGVDVSTERQNAKALAEGKRRLSTLISNMPGMVYRSVYNDQRTIEFVSDGSLELTGYAPWEMVLNRTISWKDVIHPDDLESLLAEYRNALVEGRPYMFTYRITTRKGEQKWVSERGGFVPFEESGLMMMEGIIMDVTAHRQAEEHARQRDLQLMQADRLASLGTMVAGVAHEINNPNTVISLNAPMLEAILADAMPLLDELYKQGRSFTLAGTDWLAVQEEVMPLLDKIKSSSRRIRTIVAELKGFARQEHHEQRQPVELAEVIRAAAELVKSKISHSTRQFSLLPDGGSGVVLGDFQRLEQVVVNVLTNACDALQSPEQGIEVRLEQEKDVFHILVRDEGHGMDTEVMSHAFDPFFSTKGPQEGIGLGLAISHSIIEQHGGTLSFESEPGKGTLCRISLPKGDPTTLFGEALAGRR